MAVKIGVLILQTALDVGFYVLIADITQKKWIGIIGLGILAFSSLHLFFISEFINSLGAITLLVWSSAAVSKFVQTRKWYWLIFVIIGISAAIISHRSTLGLLLVISISFAISWFFINAKDQTTVVISVILFFLGLMFPYSLYWIFFPNVPDFLKFEILQYPQSPFRMITLPESLMLLFAASILIACSRTGRFTVPQKTVLIAVLIWSFFTTLNPSLNHQTGFNKIVGRLDTLVLLQAATAAALSISLLRQTYNSIITVSANMIFLGLLCWSYFMPLPVGLRKEYLQEREILINQLKNTERVFCNTPLIIAPHGKQFVVTYFLGVPSQQDQPVNSDNNCVYWLVEETDIQKNITFRLLKDQNSRK